MKKRLFAGLLTAALLLGMIPPIPTQAVGADAGTGNGAEEVVGEVTATTTGTQSYTDKTANETAEYEYVITGSDGSREVVTVGPKSLENTGNKIESGQRYVKTAKASITAGKYLIVGAHTTDAGWAVKPETNCPWDKRFETKFKAGDEIVGNYTELEWDLTPVGNEYTIKKDAQFMKIVKNNSQEVGSVTIGAAGTYPNMNINVGTSAYPNSVTISGKNNGNQLGYLNRRGASHVGTYNAGSNDNGSCFYLFKKTEATVLNLAGLKALVEQAEGFDQTNFVPTSWEKLQKAIADSKAFITAEAAKSYNNEAEATFQLAEANRIYTMLWNTMLTLEAKTVDLSADTSVIGTKEIKPSIIWQRTLEYGHDKPNDSGNLALDVPTYGNVTTGGTTRTDLQKIVWNWDKLANLTTDPTMTVWDYNKDNQYANVTDSPKVPGVKAATWNKGTNDWKKSNVRKFSGEFIWPAGYDLDDRAKIVSANDANYKSIYDYVANVGETAEPNDPLRKALATRYRGATVMPINDDMYVFIYKDQETLTADNYRKHMVYWSGTSGKGIWSDSVNVDDWARTELPTYQNLSAIPAFHGKLPNLQDSRPTEGFQHKPADVSKMEHTDGWYTLTNTSSIMNTLNRLYPNQNNHQPLDGQKMHIDVYCFNNENTGGIDQLELKFIKSPKDTARVTVKYYIDSVAADNFLDSDVITGVPYNTSITLPPHANIYGLNHCKSLAYSKLQAGEVLKNGRQTEVPYKVEKGKDNVINVVYERQTDRAKEYTYDFGVTNKYTHTLLEENATNVTLVNQVKGLTVEAPVDNQCVITYQPTNSLNETATAILEVTHNPSGANATARTYRETVHIQPASNVLYEENYFTENQVAVPGGTDFYRSWTASTAGTTPVATEVNDNESTVFGYARSYDNAEPNDKVFEATVEKPIYVVDSATNKPVLQNKSATKTNNLTANFVGTGIDLIGTCGPNTGTLMVKIENANGKLEKGYIVNTLYVHKEIKHVPLLHCQGLANGQHKITAAGLYVENGTSGKVSTMSLSDDVVSEMQEQLLEFGFTEEDLEKIEVVNTKENSAIETYDLASEENVETATVTSELKLGLDSFRVYGPTTISTYPTNEKDLKYENILKCVNDGFAAYIEKEVAPGGTYTKADYEAKGGPQYELYLENADTQATALALNNAGITQVSLRSVTGEPVEVELSGERHTISSPVEMYYNITPDTNGYVTIKMTSSTGILALGNVKMTGELVKVASEDLPKIYELLEKEAVEPDDQQGGQDDQQGGQDNQQQGEQNNQQQGGQNNQQGGQNNQQQGGQNNQQQGGQNNQQQGEQNNQQQGGQNNQQQSGQNNQQSQTKPGSNGSAVQTGDTTNFLMIIVVLGLSVVVMFAIGKRRKNFGK